MSAKKLIIKKFLAVSFGIFFIFSFFNSTRTKSIGACCPTGYEVCDWYCPNGQCGSCSCYAENGCKYCCSVPDGYDQYGNPKTKCATSCTYCGTRYSCINCNNYNCCKVCDDSCNGTCTLPSCPSGYTRTNPNNLCSSDTRTISCTYKNDCNNTCRRTATCYRTETNVKTSAPTSISLSIKNVLNNDEYVAHNLSQDPGNPTTVIMACPGTFPRAQIYVPSKTAPSTSSGLGYSYRVNNFGVNNEWRDFACDRPEDFCLSDSTTRIRNFAPNTYSVPAVLKEGAKGLIRGRYYTINRCNNNVIYSDWTVGYYEVETNTVPQPTEWNRVTLKIDGKSYTLPVDSAQPITVKQPSADNNVEVTIPTKTKPSTSSELGYIFRTTNNPSGSYNTEGLTNTLPFTPTGGARSYLQETSTGNVRGIYYTKNRCGLNKIESSAINGYYKVNNGPDILCPCDPNMLLDDPLCCLDDGGKCRCDESMEASNPLCCADDDGKCRCDENLLPTDPNCCIEVPPIFYEVGSDVSMKGCKSTQYTGKEINNPLKIRLTGKDEDSAEEIIGAVIWFDTVSSNPTVMEISGSFNNPHPGTIGIMLLQNSNWDNDPYIYTLGSDNKWKTLGSSNTITVGEIGGNYAQIQIADIDIEQQGDTVRFDLSLDFLSSSTLTGLYNLKSLILDKYMIFTDDSGKYKVDLSSIKKYFEWGFDFNNPTVARSNQKVLGPQKLELTIDSNGTGSKITDMVLSPYKAGDLINGTIQLLKPLTGYDGNNPLTVDNDISQVLVDNIGHLQGQYSLNTWHFGNLDITPYSNTLEIDIQQSEQGAIVLYSTVYDQGCNYADGEHRINLTPWIATKGGILYSENNFGPSANIVDEALENPFLGSLRNILAAELRTGTELISSRQNLSLQLRYPDLGAVIAQNIYDYNDRKSYWYDYLKKKLESMKDNYVQIEAPENLSEPSSSVCPAGTSNCLLYSEEDINVEIGFACDINTLIMSEKDIILNPNITENENNQTTTGCIFLAKGNIIIEEGNRSSGETTIGYDYIEGFLIAENQIDIKKGDPLEDIRDGLEIKGGLVAMGRDAVNSSAILLQRNLRLYTYSNPTLVVSWDIKYARLSEIFFGTEAPLYKQEVGFKVF